MSQIQTNVSLQQLNTFKVDAAASAFVEINDCEQLVKLQPEMSHYNERLILGGGSNILFIGDYSGLVIYPQLKGIQVITENEEQVTLRCRLQKIGTSSFVTL